MTNSIKKQPAHGALPRSIERMVGRSSSTKKASSSGSAAVGSSSKKKKAAWDDTNHDLSVYKLPMKKLLEKQLQMMSKETLCKIAGIEAPVRHTSRSVREESALLPIASPTSTTRSQHRRASQEFSSPDSNNDSSFGSASSTPESAGDREDESPVSYRPTAGGKKEQQPKTLVHTAKPINKKTTQASEVHVESQPQPVRRRSVAPTTTVAPPMSAAQQQYEDEYIPSSLSSSLSSSLPPSLESSYEPSWLKVDSMLSPVLERSIEASITAQSPAADHTYGAAAEHTEDAYGQEKDQQDGGRNLLQELRASLAPGGGSPVFASSSPPLSMAPVSSPLSSPSFPSDLMPLLSQLSHHLHEQSAKRAQEQQFRSMIVDSFSHAASQMKVTQERIDQLEQANATMKTLQGRVEEIEQENRQLRHQLEQQRIESERKEHGLTLQVRTMEMKIEQIMTAMRSQMPTLLPMPMTTPVSQPAHSSYDPSIYSSRPHTAPHINTATATAMMPALFPANQPATPSTLPSHPSAATPVSSAIAAASIERDSHPRASSPPRPIVVGGHQHITQQPHQHHQHQQQRDSGVAAPRLQGHRLTEVSVVRTGAMPHPNSTSLAATTLTRQNQPTHHHHQQQQQHPHAAASHAPSQRVAWQTHQAPNTTSVQPSHAANGGATAMTPTNKSHFRAFDSHVADSVSDSVDLSSPSLVVFSPRPPAAYSTSTLSVPPLSPGDAEDAAESARFERAANEAKERIAQAIRTVDNKNGTNKHAQQQHQQQQQQQSQQPPPYSRGVGVAQGLAR